MKYEDITKRIIGCAMKVHSFLGNGFQEVIYQRALEIEMTLDGLQFEREKEMPVMYKGYNIGTRRVDVHLAQGKNYLEAYNMEVGLLINFGAKSLEFKRLFNRLNQDSQD